MFRAWLIVDPLLDSSPLQHGVRQQQALGAEAAEGKLQPHLVQCDTRLAFGKP